RLRGQLRWFDESIGPGDGRIRRQRERYLDRRPLGGRYLATAVPGEPSERVSAARGRNRLGNRQLIPDSPPLHPGEIRDRHLRLDASSPGPRGRPLAVLRRGHT